ncbi:hypothetical protein PENTCL1PPCAC_9863, partial [Pristionchus entomophagus]
FRIANSGYIEAKMIWMSLVLFGLFSSVTFISAQDSLCVDNTSVCVPFQQIEPGCHCILTRRALTSNDYVYKILSQKAVDELNRFFSVNESAPVPVDTSVFAKLHDKVHTHLMTFPTSLAGKIISKQDDWLTSQTIRRLINCTEPRCEVINETTDLQGNPPPTRPDRAFRVSRALRYDIEGEGRTLLALASATSDFLLTKKSVRKCHHQLFWKKCHTEWILREFDAQSRADWMKHVSHAMIGGFRREMADLLV